MASRGMNEKHITDGTFKVPKIKSKAFLEPIPLDSSKYKTQIWPNLLKNFKMPTNSEKQLKVLSAWLINNSEAEDRHIARRKLMRKQMPMMSSSIGFIYFNDWETIRQISRSGTIANGNITNSYLAKSSMGVSICQFSDIFNEGYTRNGWIDAEYLVLVKYLRGKVKYVQCDSSPMDPQPHFDCHMAKNPFIDKNTTCKNAFHQSQVFIYEYDEDGEIENNMSKVLPFAAIELTWIGPYLYRMIGDVVSIKKKDTLIQKISSTTTEMKRERNQFIKSTSLKVSENKGLRTSFPINRENQKSMLSIRLTIKCRPGHQLKSITNMYFSNDIMSLMSRFNNTWEISGIIENNEFEKEWKCRHDKSRKSLPDFISISLESPNLLHSSNHHNSLNIKQFVSYTKILIKNNTYTKGLNNILKLSETMGVISQPLKRDASILIFPNGKLSDKLGIHMVDGDSYFHALVFHSEGSYFNVLNVSEMERNTYLSCLSTLTEQQNQLKSPRLSALINLQILKQTVKLQAEEQRSSSLTIFTTQQRKKMISYLPICFESICDDFQCHYHNPMKRGRINESRNKENIASQSRDHKMKLKEKPDIGCDQNILNDNKGSIKNTEEQVSEKRKETAVEMTKHKCIKKETKGNDQIKLNDIKMIHKTYQIKHKDEEMTQRYAKKNHTDIVKKHDVIKHNVVKIIDKDDPKNSYNNQIEEEDIQKNEGSDQKVVPCCSSSYNESHSPESSSIEKAEEKVLNNKSENGLFYPLEFLTFCNAGYSDLDGLKMIEFKYQTGNSFNDSNKIYSVDMWSINKDRFKKDRNWPGTSFYE